MLLFFFPPLKLVSLHELSLFAQAHIPHVTSQFETYNNDWRILHFTLQSHSQDEIIVFFSFSTKIFEGLNQSFDSDEVLFLWAKLILRNLTERTTPQNVTQKSLFSMQETSIDVIPRP